MLEVVPDHAGHDAGAVGERQSDVVGAGAGLAQLVVSHEQHLVDGAAVLQVAKIADLVGSGEKFHVG